jgi:SOS-response transcriptional repressor LexA
MARPESFEFRARIARTWILYTVDVPARVSRALSIEGAKGKVPVVFTLDGGSPRKTTLAPRQGGGHRLHVHSDSRREAGAKEGDTVTIVLSRDLDPGAIELPPDLEEALREAGVLETFRSMGPAMRRELTAYVEKAKRDVTRSKYVARVVERAGEEREKRVDREARRREKRVPPKGA